MKEKNLKKNQMFYITKDANIIVEFYKERKMLRNCQEIPISKQIRHQNQLQKLLGNSNIQTD